MAYRSGLAILGLFAVMILIGAANEPGPRDTEMAYRDAQLAVARATGRPCDYRCKEVIADLSLDRAPPP